MDNGRIDTHPILANAEIRKQVSFSFNNRVYYGLQGDTIASALLANGIRTLRLHEETGSPRGLYCNIGHCYECRVNLNGMDGVRACLTTIREGMVVMSGAILPTPLKKGD